MLYLSTVPSNKSQFENSFICLGSVQSFGFTNTFSGSVTGILSRPTNEAIYVDSMQGAYDRLAITTLRITDPSASYTAGSVSTDNPYLDSISGSDLSTDAFIRKLIEMRQTVQMKNNAFILRIYNVEMGNSNYKSLPVFLDSFTVRLEMDRPFETQFDFNFIIRNEGVGFS